MAKKRKGRPKSRWVRLWLGRVICCLCGFNGVMLVEFPGPEPPEHGVCPRCGNNSAEIDDPV
jgi:hypothetical protein